ncbi:cysteine-rich receptor-like protein kinase [Trifolium pratense]|uniref:Cysteine-rich receptor-like protein kinase n=1 Tax=Trifolium pratense TaxID=57577 RepID=A0A2K3LML3_TRIPR|nr:cysteine-rich receptor-like protein kinase [Trifolium pratense]
MRMPDGMHLVMGSVISESHTAFVKDRKILDGNLIANEVVDEARRTKKELLFFKVYFEKAWYSVGGHASVTVSHLQFANDTLLMGTKSSVNVCALRAVLMLFETMSGLRVHFHKSMLVGVNISVSLLGEAASALCCRVRKIPFLYMGIPIGGDSRFLGIGVGSFT